MTFASNWKPSRTARKKAEHKAKAERRNQEDTEKRKVRKRDKVCRFPLCGCRKLRLPLEVSHDFHKGMGSKDGVSIAPLMVLLCNHRHQFGAISRHRGTLRSIYLTPDQYDGPVAWEVHLGDVAYPQGWIEVARESAPGVLEPLTAPQAELLRRLAEMEL